MYRNASNRLPVFLINLLFPAPRRTPLFDMVNTPVFFAVSDQSDFCCWEVWTTEWSISRGTNIIHHNLFRAHSPEAECRAVCAGFVSPPRVILIIHKTNIPCAIRTAPPLRHGCLRKPVIFGRLGGIKLLECCQFFGTNYALSFVCCATFCAHCLLPRSSVSKHHTVIVLGKCLFVFFCACFSKETYLAKSCAVAQDYGLGRNTAYSSYTEICMEVR